MFKEGDRVIPNPVLRYCIFLSVANVREFAEKVEDMEKANQSAQAEVGKKEKRFRMMFGGPAGVLVHVKVASLSVFFL